MSKTNWKDWTLFLDRDGVINRKVEGDYVRHWRNFSFLPGSLSGLKILSALFKRLIIVTNQRGIARGLMTAETLREIHARMTRHLQQRGIRVDGIYVCPHETMAGCKCRKPGIGLFEKAREDFPDINFRKSIVAGDSATDLEAARKIEARPVLIGTAQRGTIQSYRSLRDFGRQLQREP